MKAMVIGSTGMVGSEVLNELLKTEKISHVICINRRPSDVKNPKFEEVIHTDFTDFSALFYRLADIQLVFYCLGVYRWAVKEKAYWRITVDYQDALVRELEKINKKITFCLFSAQGADMTSKSRFLFARVKGKAESNLLNSKLEKKYIFRPGFINPDHGHNPRGYGLFQASMYGIGSAIHKMTPFKGVNASDLGKIMVRVALAGSRREVFESNDIKILIKNF